MHEKNHSDDRLKYFVIGGAIGALATLFLTPKSGKETRDFLISKAHEGKEAVEGGIRRGEDKIIEQSEKLASEARDLIERARDMSKREKQIILAAIEAGRKAYKGGKDCLGR